MTTTKNAVSYTATRRSDDTSTSRVFPTRHATTTRRYRKSDVDFHGADFGRGMTPAIDVKVRGSGLSLHDQGWRTFDKNRAAEGYDAAFTEQWLNACVCRERGIDQEDCGVNDVDQAVAEFLDTWWTFACEMGLENATNDLEHFFAKTPLAYDLGLPPYDYKPAATCHLTGRSGGWLYLGDTQGRPKFDSDDVTHWNAITVAAWGRFEAQCRRYVDDIPYQTLDLVYHNVYLAEKEREAAIVAEMVA